MTMGIDHLPRPCDLTVGGAAEAECGRLRAELNALKQRQQRRKPRFDRMITEAEKVGKHVRSISTPDGYTLGFAEPEDRAANDLDEWIAKHARKIERR